MYIYAQLDENKICIGISQLAGEVNADNMIRLDSFDQDKIWRKFDTATNIWSAEKYNPQPIPLSELDEMKALLAAQSVLLAEMVGA